MAMWEAHVGCGEGGACYTGLKLFLHPMMPPYSQGGLKSFQGINVSIFFSSTHWNSVLFVWTLSFERHFVPSQRQPLFFLTHFFCCNKWWNSRWRLRFCFIGAGYPKCFATGGCYSLQPGQWPLLFWGKVGWRGIFFELKIQCAVGNRKFCSWKEPESNKGICSHSVMGSWASARLSNSHVLFLISPRLNLKSKVVQVFHKFAWKVISYLKLHHGSS